MQQQNGGRMKWLEEDGLFNFTGMASDSKEAEIISNLAEIISMKWRPELKKTVSKCRPKLWKSWKAWGKTRKYPMFEVGITDRDIFRPGKPLIEATKNHLGGIGSVWTFDLESVDKLIIMLLYARIDLKKHPKFVPEEKL